MRKSPLYAFFWALFLVLGGLSTVLLILIAVLYGLSDQSLFAEQMAAVLATILLPFVLVALLALALPPTQEAFDNGGGAGVVLVLVIAFAFGALIISRFFGG